MQSSMSIYAKTVECYVEDITVKSNNKGDHLVDLKRVFDIMRAHQLKTNTATYIFLVPRAPIRSSNDLTLETSSSTFVLKEARR